MVTPNWLKNKVLLPTRWDLCFTSTGMQQHSWLRPFEAGSHTLQMQQPDIPSWGHTSAVEHLLRMHQALGSIPSTSKEDEKKTRESASWWVTALSASPPCETHLATPWPGHDLFIFSFPVPLEVGDGPLAVFYWSLRSLSVCCPTEQFRCRTAGLHAALYCPRLPRSWRLLFAPCSFNKI